MEASFSGRTIVEACITVADAPEPTCIWWLTRFSGRIAAQSWSSRCFSESPAWACGKARLREADLGRAEADLGRGTCSGSG